MTQAEIIEMARQAGIIAVHTEGDGNWHQQFLSLEAFAKLVAAKEREACAKVCENLPAALEEFDALGRAADSIRARDESTSRGEAND